MLADGHGHQLYDASLQRQYQARFSGRVGTLYIHPPFEAALYLAVAWLPLRPAYLLWFLLNLAFLAAAARHLARSALAPWDWRILLAASLTFVPLLLCLLQGQDSLLLLLLVILSFTALRRDRAFAAGCWLALGLFKFQLVLPLAFVLILTRSAKTRGEFVKGFSLVALGLAGLSAAISGWAVFAIYPRFLAHLQTQPFAGIVPRAMANFRGVAALFLPGESAWAMTAIAILSAAALFKTATIKAATVWKPVTPASGQNSATAGQNEFDSAFATTVLFALLVSYHLNPHDLSLLLLPISLLLHGLWRARQPDAAAWGARIGITATLLGILFLPPLHVWALKANLYALFAVPVLFLFLVSSRRTPKTKMGKAKVE